MEHPAPSVLCVTSQEAHLELTSQKLWGERVGLATGGQIAMEKRDRAWIQQPALETWQT